MKYRVLQDFEMMDVRPQMFDCLHKAKKHIKIIMENVDLWEEIKGTQYISKWKSKSHWEDIIILEEV